MDIEDTPTTIKGIGKRTAERLIVELKTKIQNVAPGIALTGKAPEDGASPEADAFGRDAEDAVAGLITLGIKADAARKCVREVINEAAEFAQTSPEPDPSELYTDILLEA